MRDTALTYRVIEETSNITHTIHTIHLHTHMSIYTQVHTCITHAQGKKSKDRLRTAGFHRSLWERLQQKWKGPVQP